jgi:hypothetical protein
VVDEPGDFPRALPANDSEFPNSCCRIQLRFFEDVVQVLVNGRHGDVEELTSRLAIRPPDAARSPGTDALGLEERRLTGSLSRPAEDLCRGWDERSGLCDPVRAFIARVGGLPSRGGRFLDPEILVFDPGVTFPEPQVTLSEPGVTFSDLQVALSRLRVTFLDPRVTFSDPRVTFSDIRVAFSDPRVTFSDLQVTSPDLRVTLSDLRVAFSDPQVEVSDPQVAFFDPQVTFSDPRVTSPDPEVTLSDPRVTFSGIFP